MFPLTPDQHHWLDVATEDEGWCSFTSCTPSRSRARTDVSIKMYYRTALDIHYKHTASYLHVAVMLQSIIKCFISKTKLINSQNTINTSKHYTQTSFCHINRTKWCHAPSDINHCSIQATNTSMLRFWRAMLCIKCGLCRHAVCVCLYVCLSRSWIISKRINIIFEIFYHRVATPL